MKTYPRNVNLGLGGTEQDFTAQIDDDPQSPTYGDVGLTQVGSTTAMIFSPDPASIPALLDGFANGTLSFEADESTSTPALLVGFNAVSLPGKPAQM